MGRELLFTTETDDRHRHTMVDKTTEDLLANVLMVEVKAVDEDESSVVLINNGQEVPEHITDINNITTELIREKGSTVEEAAEILSNIIKDGDTLITHTAKFHKTSLEYIYFLAGKEPPKVNYVCLCKDFVEVFKIPAKFDGAKKTDYKYPTLKELRQKYFIPSDIDKIDGLHMIYNETKKFFKGMLKGEQKAS